MDAGDSTPLAGAEIHGFCTAADFHIEKLMEDASTRWFRPNEVHAILSNYTRFKIQPQPVNIPPSGSVLLFDRKMLRNFRKDGHNWKKKKDGKTVQEAHEKLKIGNEERIHVYYARSEDDPSFYRRCYWLLDKNLERIVLVHYRQTPEDNAVEKLPTSAECQDDFFLANKMHHGSPSTPVNSSDSSHSETAGSATVSEVINSSEDYAIYTGSGVPLAEECAELQKHELSLHEINTLDWADLVEGPTCIDSNMQKEGDVLSSDQQRQYESRNFMNNGSILPSQGTSSFGNPIAVNAGNGFNCIKQMNSNFCQTTKGQEDQSLLLKNMNPNTQGTDLCSNPSDTNETHGIFSDHIFLNQNSFGQWNDINNDSLGSLDDLHLEAPILNDHKSDALGITNHSSTQQEVFSITDVSPAWAYSTEETKVLVIGQFYETHKHLEGSNIYCVFGEICVAAEMVQPGVYRCTASPQAPGSVNFYLTLDGLTPISQVLNFDYRSTPRVKLDYGLPSGETSSEVDNDQFKWKDTVQIRLAHLLFSTTNMISILSSRIQSKSLKEAKQFALRTSPLVEKDWMNLLGSSGNNVVSYIPTSRDLFEVVLKNKLQEWLLEKVAEGCKTTARDSQGQGVIHLCAMLDYTWAIRLFTLSSLSLDFRDAFGWTALHWAAYYGREKMVAALLSAGANPSLVSDPTPEFPGGCIAADVASIQGYEGLAAYLAEKGLTAHFQAMSLSGNITAPQPRKLNDLADSENLYAENLSESEICLKESLAAYRNAANAADHIQAAFRERSLKLQTKAIKLAKPEMEAANIIAALKIQHAFRNYNRRKMTKAAAQIQSHFRTWQARKNYLYMRRQAIKIQAAFRGHRERKQYRKIIWSVGVLEKAILRWRLKKKGLRGVQTTEMMTVDKEQENTVEEKTVEEDFYRISREQAEERVQRSVVRVQAMFRSYRAQQDYRRMKLLAHEQAKLEQYELMGPANANRCLFQD